MYKFEVKTACGYLRDIPNSVKAVIYKPDHSCKDVAGTTYIFSREGFFGDGFIGGYVGRGSMIHKNGHLQSFHWTDNNGCEYRPKASKAIEGYMISVFDCQPTLQDFFDYLGKSSEGLDELVTLRYMQEREKNASSGAFGSALEIALKEMLTPQSKYKGRTSPAGHADLTIKVKFNELAKELGIDIEG